MGVGRVWRVVGSGVVSGDDGPGSVMTVASAVVIVGVVLTFRIASILWRVGRGLAWT